jgi:DNA polymerase III subunit delta
MKIKQGRPPVESSQQIEKPTVYIFHGDDTHAMKRHLEAMIEQMGDPSIADLNITRLDGRQTNDDEIRSAANSMPFLSDRRMVILTSPFTRLNSDASRKRFQALLEGLPPSTALVLMVEDYVDRRDWKSLHGNHWIRKWMLAAGKQRAHYQLCQLPALNRMPEWIREEARRQGGQFHQEAAAALSAHVGNDTRTASQEINKLLIYVDFKRAVEAEDVEELTAPGGQADVFDMVDALAAGSAKQALSLLQRLLETQEPLSLFGMIVRQFRLLIQARELIDQGRASQLSGELRLPGFVTDRLASQARRFSMPQLEDIYHRLLKMDEAMKTSQMPSGLVLETFIAEMAR